MSEIQLGFSELLHLNNINSSCAILEGAGRRERGRERRAIGVREGEREERRREEREGEREKRGERWENLKLMILASNL